MIRRGYEGRGDGVDERDHWVSVSDDWVSVGDEGGKDSDEVRSTRLSIGVEPTGTELMHMGSVGTVLTGVRLVVIVSVDCSLRFDGAVCARSDGPVVGVGSLGITSCVERIGLSSLHSSSASTLVTALSIDVGGVDEIIDTAAIELPADVEAEFMAEPGADPTNPVIPDVCPRLALPLNSAEFFLICDMRKPCFPLGLLDRLVGLGRGCESKMCTCRSRPFFGIVTPPAPRGLLGGTPTRRHLGDGDEDNSACIKASTSGIEITVVTWEKRYGKESQSDISNSAHDRNVKLRTNVLGLDVSVYQVALLM